MCRFVLILSAFFNNAFSCQIAFYMQRLLGGGGGRGGGGGGGAGAGMKSKFPGTFRATHKIGKPLCRGLFTARSLRVARILSGPRQLQPITAF